MYDVDKLRFWCQKIIPLVYDDSLSYYELLCKVVYKLNELVENVNDIPEYIGQLISEEGLQEIMRTLLVNLEKQIANANEGESETATGDRAVGTLVWLNGYLYRATKFIDAGDRYIVDGNIEKITIEEVIKDVMLALTDNYEDGERVASEDREAGELVWFKNQLLYIKADIDEGNAYTDLNSEVVDFSKLFKNIHDDITSEATARANADTALGQRITDEATARANADTALGQRITDEATARANADTALGQSIAEVETKVDDVRVIWVSPKKYGAVGDGETDDTEAVQNCINENNYVIIDGNFYVTAPIVLHSNLYMKGSGSFYNPLITRTLFGNNVNNVTLEGFSFVNGERNNSHPDMVANIYIEGGTKIIIDGIKDILNNKPSTVMLDHVTDFSVKNCIILKSGYCGIMLHGNCHYGVIANNEVEVDDYTGYTNTYGIAVSFTPTSGTLDDRSNECTHVVIDSNVIYTALSYWEGIDAHAGQYLEITNNIVKGFYVGICCTYGNYSSLNMGTRYSKISGNTISADGVTLHSDRTYRLGIGFYSNSASGEVNNVISDNYISNMNSDSENGMGIEFRGLGFEVVGNTFQKYIRKAIRINQAGRALIQNNTFIGAGVCSAIVFNYLSDVVGIYNNTASRYRNFYEIEDNNGLASFARRNGNKITSGYWMNDQYAVTSVNAFVPDYCKVSPAGASYHPLDEITLRAEVATGQPMGWISDGNTWHAMPNLT